MEDQSNDVVGFAEADSLMGLASKLRLGERLSGDRQESYGAFNIPGEKSDFEDYLWIEEVENISSPEKLVEMLENLR